MIFVSLQSSGSSLRQKPWVCLCPLLSFSHFLWLFFQEADACLAWGPHRGWSTCPWSEFQIKSFHLLRSRPCCCLYVTHLYVICCHFIQSYAGLSLLKISSCRVNTTSRLGIKQLGISFSSIFLLFFNESSQGPHS